MQSHRGCTSTLRLVTLACVMSVGLHASPTAAQTTGATSATGVRPHEPPVAAKQAAVGQTAPKHGEQYFIELRSRYAMSYGHTFVVFGRGAAPGKKIKPEQIAGLHPATNSAIPWYIGHVVPVKSETGASEGDTDEIYVSARYRVVLNKSEYDRDLAYIRKLQATKTLWQAEAYNCNDFVADIARFMGLKVPSTMLFPQDFINGIRELNGGGGPRGPVATASSSVAPSTPPPPTTVDTR